jgi:Domain of unknown function (DUF4129)
MKRVLLQLAVLLSCILLPAASRAADTASVSLQEYRRQLHELTARVDSLSEHPEQTASVVVTIPEKVTVLTGSGQITVSYRDLKDDLAAISRADPEKRSAMLLRVQKYLHALNDEAGAHDRETQTPVARQKLDAILSRREFRSAQAGPSLGQILMAKFFRWLMRLLRGSGNAAFDWLQLAVYGLVGTVLVLLLIWIAQRFRSGKEEPAGREIIPFAPSARGWRTWLAEARADAQRQDWRNAIHLAYWAGIAFLEENGAWKPNRARTPREYLRLVGTRGSQYTPLAALTRKFEIVWYGNRHTAASDFDEALQQLEKLGCR